MKAWLGQSAITYKRHILYADTRAEARKLAEAELTPPKYIKIRRAKWADDYDDFLNIPPQLLLERGWPFACHKCGKKLDKIVGLHKGMDELFYCTECYEK